MRFGDLAPALALAFAALMMLLAYVPPCQTEDSSNCYWNAQTMGNGNGRSFIDINGYLIRL